MASAISHTVLLFALFYYAANCGAQAAAEPTLDALPVLTDQPQQSLQEPALDSTQPDSELPADITVSEALNTDRLWLPNSYRRHWRRLQNSALAVLAMPRCNEVVRGELARNESSLDAPVFAIICRDSNKKTYVQKVDGMTLAIEPTRYDLDLQAALLAEQERAALAAELAAKQAAELAAKQAAELAAQQAVEQEKSAAAGTEQLSNLEQQLSAACSSAWGEALANMQGVKWLSDMEVAQADSVDFPPIVLEPELAAAVVSSASDASVDVDISAATEAESPLPVFNFQRDFNAVDPHNNPLHYRALCSVKSETDVNAKVIPRRE